MARIPLAEIPNAPTGGKPALANPQFPSFEVGNQAIAQIREGYQSNMVDERAAGAMGRAMQSVGGDLTQIGLEGMDAVVSISRMAEKEATGQFLANLTEVQSEMKGQMAGADPSMYPVIVKNTYRDKDGNLNPRLLAGVSQWGMKYAQADALRSESKDMAEYSLQAHLATLEQDEGRKLAAMQTLMTSGQFSDAEAMNESLFATRRISPDQYASNKVSIAANRDNQTLLASIQSDPEGMAKKLTTAMMEGKPIDLVKNISLESYPRYIKAAEYANTLQTAERLTTLTDLIDGKSLLSLDALRANPIFKTLDQEKQSALTRRLTNSTAGTPASEVAIKTSYNKLASFPSTDKPWEEYATLATEAAANLVDPYFSPFMDKLNARVAEMAENGGVLAPNSKIEKYVADKLDLFSSMGMFGQVPAKESGMEQSPEYVQQTLAIETRKMELMQEFRSAGIKTQAQADEFLNTRLLPADAKNAWKAEPNTFQKVWRSMFPSAPAKPDGSPVPAKTPVPRGMGMPTGNEVSMFDPDVSDLTGGAYAFKVTDKTRDALPASTPSARQVSLDFNDAASPTARGVEIIIPNDATEEERAIAQAYVDRTTEWFRSKGIDVPNRGVRTAKENGRGTRGRFHTEPFFVADSDALAAVQNDPEGYAKVLASTLGRINGVTFIAPHKSTDPGASRGNVNERDFARQVIIPALKNLAT
jgi:hypothetical protein